MKRKPDPIFSLWILIALALCVFIGLSFVEDLRIGSYELNKGSFKELMLASNDSESVIPETLPEIDTIPQLQEELLIEPDTTIRKIFIFGDSMTHNLAMSLARYGSKNGYKINSVTWESSSILSWANSDKIGKYIEEFNPDFIIVSLGSNELELKNFEARAKSVKKIIEKIGERPYLWVGPPLWKTDRGLYKMIGDNVNSKNLFRIDSLDIERGPDHIHPTRKGADQWADSLMRWQLKGPHPILAEKPDSLSTLKGHKFIYLHPDD